MKAKAISAAVCTYNRASDLRFCLDHLTKQTLPKESFEVIVVDNNSTDDTKSVVSDFARLNDNIVYVREQKQGLAAARNRALKVAKSEIVAFTDDDAEPLPTWLEEIHKSFMSLPTNVAAVGGEVIPIWGIARPKWLNDRLLHPISAGLKWDTRPRLLSGNEWLIEVNVAYRRRIITKYGGFPEHLGRIGLNLLSGENAVNLLIGAGGGTFFFDPSILVRHKIGAERLTKPWFRRRYFWQGATNYFVNKYVLDFIDRNMGSDLDFEELKRQVDWFSLKLPASTQHWAELFDDDRDEGFSQQLQMLEGVGYLLASQGLILGR